MTTRQVRTFRSCLSLQQFGSAAVALTICSVFAGCSVIKASPAETSNFLPVRAMLTEMRDRAPFHGVWYRDRDNYAELKKRRTLLVIKPVNTEFVEARIRQTAVNEASATRRIEDAHEVAKYMEERFKSAVRDYPNHPLKITEQSTPDALILELAIVDIVPTNAVVNAVGTAAGSFIPGAGLISVAGKGSVAIEGLVRDGASGEVWVQFKDRESDKRAPFTVKDFQQYAHARQAIDDWAEQYAELSATPLNHRVAESLPFTLSPF